MKRLEPIDYARGVFAFGIMAYHIIHYCGAAMPAVLSSVGIYGVEAFFVISGVSFGYTCGDMALSAGSIRAFAIKRFARIAPLYWLATAMTMVALWGLYRPFSIAVNASLLFGLVNPAWAIPTGGWSIGCEMVFYLTFPFVACARRSNQTAYYAILAASVAAACWVTLGLDENTSIQSQWRAYVSPLNHVAFFMAGVAIASAIGRIRLTATTAVAVIVGACTAFVLLSVDADRIVIVTGWRRAVLSLACIAACAAIALGDMEVRGRRGTALSWLGAVSYSVYLLHPIVYKAVENVRPVLAPWACVPLTMALAHVSYKYIEMPCIAIGKRFAAQGKQRPVTASAVSRSA